MRKGSIRNSILTLALFASAHSADAHGIAGNRFFVGTLTFDDPSVADEAIVPNFSEILDRLGGLHHDCYFVTRLFAISSPHGSLGEEGVRCSWRAVVSAVRAPFSSRLFVATA